MTSCASYERLCYWLHKRFVLLLKTKGWSLPQAHICDLITSRKTEKPQWPFCLWLVSPVFMSHTLQTPKWAFSPKLCSAASDGVRFTLRPRNSPEGPVISATGGVTTKYLPRRHILLMQVGGIWESPVPAPPAAAQASHNLSLYKAFRCRERRPITTAQLCSIFNISEVWGGQDPNLCWGAGGTPTTRPLLENNGLPLPSHWVQVSLLHECDGDWTAFHQLDAPVWAFVTADGSCEVTQPDRQFLQGVVCDLLTTWQIQVLEWQTGSKQWPAERNNDNYFIKSQK